MYILGLYLYLKILDTRVIAIFNLFTATFIFYDNIEKDCNKIVITIPLLMVCIGDSCNVFNFVFELSEKVSVSECSNFHASLLGGALSPMFTH